MTISGMVKRSGWPTVSLAAIALMMAASVSSEAGAPKTAGMKTPAAARAQADLAPQQKPVQMRYFGGPKSMMSAR